MRRFLLLVLVTVFTDSTLLSRGQSVDSDKAYRAALAWIEQSPVFQDAHRKMPSGERFQISNVDLILTNYAGTEALYHVSLEPSGFLLINANESLSPVIAFSPTASLYLEDESQNPFFSMVLLGQRNASQFMAAVNASGQSASRTDSLVQESADNRAKWKTLLQIRPVPLSVDVSPESILVAPMLETSWTQWRNYNNFCPISTSPEDATNGFNGRVPTGCVPTAGAQLMKYHEWPPYGIGSHAYTDTKGTLHGDHSASFSDGYDWVNMQPEYSPWKDEDGVKALAVSELMFELGVSIDADYEPTGTSASTLKLAEALNAYFHYEKGLYQKRTYETESAFDERLRKNLLESCPVIASVHNHAFVVDGLSQEPLDYFYHINYGWGSSTVYSGRTNYNVWCSLYDVRGDYAESAVFGIKPEFMPLFSQPDPITVTGKYYTVIWRFPKRLAPKVVRFRLKDNGTLLYDYFPPDSWNCLLTDLTAGRHSITVQAFDGIKWGPDSPPKVVQVIANPPQVAINPPAQEGYIGNSVVFSVTASGAGPFSYQWKHNGVIMPGQSGSALQLSDLQTAHAGNYTVVVSNAGGQSESSGNLTLKPSPALPPPWVHADIGGPALKGDARPATNRFHLEGGGTDIWNEADQFHFAYQQLEGDCQIIARVVSQENTDPWCKAGVMIRESLSADARHAMMVITPGNGTSFQRRLATGAISLHTTPGDHIFAPYWIRLNRRGDVFTGFRSSDGISWELVGSDIVSMSSPVYVGLVVTAHNDRVLASADFDNFTLDCSLLDYWSREQGGCGHFYEVVIEPSGVTWQMAKERALARGGYLATVSSEAENEFIHRLALRTALPQFGAWLGGFQNSQSPEPAGGWNWVSGEAWTYTAWHAGEPNDNSGNEDHLQLRPSDPARFNWNDFDGNAILPRYVIEFLPESILAMIKRIQLLPNRNLGVDIQGKSGLSFLLESSTDLIHWHHYRTIQQINGTIRILTPMIGSQEFYRVAQSQHTPDPQRWIWIEPGSFLIGSPVNELNREPNESPRTLVMLSRGYWMSRYEVTQGEYQAVMGNNPSHFTGDLRRPVEQVNWYDATNYCGKLTERERAAGRLPAGYIYRLPTEAEWEYACRAGTTTRFSYGEDLGYDELDKYAVFVSNSGGTTHPVGSKLANPWGLFDMQGNVWEWCMDLFGAYPGGMVTNPTGPASGSIRILRGGSWDYFAWGCRSAARGTTALDTRHHAFGFRIVLASSD